MRNLTLFFTLFSIINCYAQDGELDPTFGDGGKVITNVRNYGGQEARSIAVQKDNKIIVSGYFENDFGYDFVTFRYNPDGSLDSTYGNDGIAITNLSSSDYINSIAIQEDSKIVVAGGTYNGSDSDLAALRYTADGILDSTFNDSGIVVTPIGSGSGYGRSISIQEDGKIVVAGGAQNGSDYDFAVVRYNINGSLDSTFNNDGIVIAPIGSGNDNVQSMSIQEGGKIFVVGFTQNGDDRAVAAARFNTDGNLDNTYNNNGTVITSIASGSIYYISSVVIHNDGGIVVVGRSRNESEWNYIIEKYNNNVILDSTFNKTGIIVIPNCASCGVYSHSDAVVVQSDGKIIFGGTGSNGTNYDFMLIRYNTSGTIDSTFGDNGVILTDFDNEYNFLMALNLQDDKIVASGMSQPLDFSHHYVPIARYNVVTTTTSLKKDTPIGSQSLEVSSIMGFSIGDNIVINVGGVNEENNTITGFGSILLQTPLQFNHLAGELIVKLDPTSVNEYYVGIPNDFTILQNYPNPFNPSTFIHFTLPKSEFVTLKIYNILGEEVASLVNDKLRAGNHTYPFDGGDLASGVYMYRIEAGEFQDVKKMILLR